MKRKKIRKQPKTEKRDNDLGLPDNIRIVHSGEANPHDG